MKKLLTLSQKRWYLIVKSYLPALKNTAVYSSIMKMTFIVYWLQASLLLMRIININTHEYVRFLTTLQIYQNHKNNFQIKAYEKRQ